MSYSLNEVNATAKKATRAVGYSWGLAEEAARSVRYLCQQDIDGCAVLARYLEKIDSKKSLPEPPSFIDRELKAVGGGMCPFYSGVAVSDHAREFMNDGFTLLDVPEPALLLYFCASVVRQLRTVPGNESISAGVVWPGGQSTTDGERLVLAGALVEHGEEVTLRLTETPGAGSSQEWRYRATPSAATWQKLTDFAHRTYAPATEESRLKGAGAGLSDND